jgi:hypothetical protein
MNNKNKKPNGSGDKVVIHLSGKSVLYLISILAALSKVM